MERRNINRDDFKVITREDGSTTIAGYAAVYYRQDDPGTQFELWKDAVERIAPGAFDRALAEDDVVAVFNHNNDIVLGRKDAGTLRLSTDRRGLRYEIDLPKARADIGEAIARGDISGSSFAFTIEHEAWRDEDGTQVREIKGVRLIDVGPVTFPAYKATTAGVRAAGDVNEAKQSYELHKQREAIFARAAAID